MPIIQSKGRPYTRNCSVCGVAVENTDRCPKHPRRARTGEYKRNAATVRANATRCYMCGDPFTPDNPPVADHIIPRAHGGSDELSNLAPACRRCNGKKGATLPPWS